MGNGSRGPEGFTEADLRGSGHRLDVAVVSTQPTFTPEQIQATGEEVMPRLITAPSDLEGMLERANIPQAVALELKKSLEALPPEALQQFAADIPGNLATIVDMAVRGATHSAYSAGKIAEADATRDRIRNVFGEVSQDGVPYQC